MIQNKQYIVHIEKVFGNNEFAIPNTIRDNIHKKYKENIIINTVFVYNNEIMLLSPHELDFMCLRFSDNTYSNYQYSNYKLMWFRFIANKASFSTDKDTEQWELGAMKRFHYTWYNPLRNYILNKYKQDINIPIIEERKRYTIYPEQQNILRVFNMDINTIKVVILGEDPYPSGNYANGLAFSSDIEPLPASLTKLKEGIIDDTKEEGIFDYTLSHLVKQGVFLLNTALTVRDGQPNSHKELWKNFITLVITVLSLRNNKIQFILLGSSAKEFANIIPYETYSAEHPAFAAREKRVWLHENVFTKVNDKLTNKIKWLNV